MFYLQIFVYFRSWNYLPMFSSKFFLCVFHNEVYELIIVYDIALK